MRLRPWHHGLVAADVLTVPAVSDALRHITITGVFYCPSYLREPWGGTVPAMPGCVWFHAVTSGHCELIVGRDRLELQAGDLALVPHGAGHRIEAGGPTDHPSIPDLPHEEQSDNYAVLRYGEDGPLTELVCGGLRLEHPSARRLLDGLPSVVHVRTVRRTVLGATLDLLAEEVRGREVGNEAVISRLCDIVVIQAIRHWMTGCRRDQLPVAAGDGRSTDRPGARRAPRRTGRAMDGRGAGVASGDVPLSVRRTISRAARPAGDGLSDRAPHATRRRPPPPQRPNRR